MKVTVRINGSNINPWSSMGMKANPFPQIPKAEFSGANELLRRLDSAPIKSEKQLREILVGCTPEFIDVCVRQYTPGKRISFDIEFPG